MPDFASVKTYQLSPDGRYVVFLADREANEMFELYRAPVLGGWVARINPPLEPGSPGISSFKITADSRYVVYLGKKGPLARNEIYSTPMEGGSTVKLTNYTLLEELLYYLVSPDSQWLLYTARPDSTSSASNLYAVPISGGAAPVKLNPPGFLADWIHIAPDSSRVVMRCIDEDLEAERLYSAPIAGGSAVHLTSEDLDFGEHIRDFGITPDGQKVVYISDHFTYNLDLYANLIADPHSQQITFTPSGSGGWGVNIFTFTSNSLGVVFVADYDHPGTNELYSVPVDGGVVNKLNKDLVAGGEAFDYYMDGFKVTPNSQRVVFRADQDTAEQFELYSVSIFGGTNTRLNAPLPATGKVQPGWKLTPNGLGVVYIADQEIAGKQQLYSVLVTGGTPYSLSQPMIPEGDVKSFAISPNNLVVVYTADKDVDEQIELYSVLITGGPSYKLNGDFFPGGNIDGPFYITPDSQAVVYRADQEKDEKFELYITASKVSLFLPLTIR
jgi:Tol biopolymer transport system component